MSPETGGGATAARPAEPNEGVLRAVGRTPLVKLTRLFEGVRFGLYAKLESLNPGGSMKDRPALSIIRRGLEAGLIGPHTVVIESSSGNMGIGLAQACSYYGLRFVCVVDPKTTAQNIRLLRAYGAEIDVVAEPHAATGEYLQARLDRVRQLLAEVPNGFWPDQYSNLWNPLAHHETMTEIVNVLGPEIDYLFCATSTCGTIRGCSDYILELGLRTRVVAVDAVGSVIFGGSKGKRLLPGHGAAVRPQLFRERMADDCVHVTDLDCVVGCRRLATREAILAGGSSGAVVAAVERYQGRIPPGARCVVILPDRGERYLDTIYSDAWVEEHFGSVEQLRHGIDEVQYV